MEMMIEGVKPMPALKPASAAMMTMEISLPPDELRRHVAVLIAAGLSKCRPRGVDVGQISAVELEGVANFVIGGFLGMAAKQGGH
jgi:hypothetical protein